MGLDGFDPVEVIVDLEDTFSISIPDRDAEQMRTAGEVCDYVLKRIPIAEPSTDVACLRASAFFEARRKLAATFAVSSRKIWPGTSVERFLPAVGRWEAWRRLSALLDIRMRGLEHPRWLLNAAVGIGFSLFVAMFLLTRRPDLWPGDPLPWYVLLPIVTFAVASALGIPWLLLWALRRRCAVHVPPSHETVGQMSSLLMTTTAYSVRQRQDEWTPHRVWEIVRCSIARSAGIPPAQVKKESRLVDLI